MNWILRVSAGWRRTSAAVTVLALLLALPGVAGARTFAFPHVFDQKGRISTTQNTFDTSLFFTYGGGLAGQPSSGLDHVVSLWLYAPDGSPMRASGGQNVCAPCTYTLSEGGGGLPGTRKLSISVDDLIESKGGFGVPPVPFDGFAVVDISNDQDPNNPSVAARAEVVRSSTGPFDQAMWGMDGSEPCPTSGTTSSRVFLLPHVIEKSGLTSGATGTPYTFDTSMFMTYTAGLAGTPTGGGATVDLYLFENDGSVMSGSLGPVCAPCTYDFASPRKQTIVLDDLITASGGFSSAVKLGFGVIVVGGADPDNVAIQGFVVNSHSSPFDLSVFGFEPQPIAAAAVASVPDLRAGDLVLELSSRPNPSRGGLDFGFDLARATRVDLGVYDAAGRKVASVFSGNREAGRHTLRWNRQDDAGNTLPAGIYFGRIAAGDGTGLSRVVVLPE